MTQITFFVGILAQCCFSARVFIQWILSERDKTIVSPTAFWYLSLLGSILMFYYGTMRNDWPIIIGQLATYYIYIANLQYKKVKWFATTNLFKISLWIFPIIALLLLFSNSNNSPIILFHSEISINLLIFGLIGQVLFTVRFIIQFVASHRKKESILPMAFWWSSIIGSLCILSYGYFRRDWVFIIGHSFGLFSYSRNILLSKHK